MMRHIRWRITGTLTTVAPLHIGSGDIVTFDHPSLKDDSGKLNDIQAVVKDYRGRPCLPGTALKGVLRSWAEAMLPTESTAITRIFGLRDVKSNTAESGWAEFCTSFFVDPDCKQQQAFAANVPYWNPDAFTGILSHVSIDRDTGAAAHNKLFFEEFVPEGVSFRVEINASRLTESEVSLLLAILEQGSRHITHPFQFGANGAGGWGRMTWQPGEVRKCDRPVISSSQVGFDCCDKIVEVTPQTIAPSSPPHVSMTLMLSMRAAFLVNDASKGKPEGCTEEGKREFTDFTPLKRADGGVWLPASSLRGVLRERAEFLLRSLNPNATGDPNAAPGNGSIERIFGKTSQVARLRMEEPTEMGRCRVDQKQDFVAIDRFTGGAAEGAKFDAAYADRPMLETRMTLNVADLKPEDFALFRLALKDVCEGNVTLGWGGSKGYGEASGTLANGSSHDIEASWDMPNSLLTDQLNQQGREWINLYLSELTHADRLLAEVKAEPISGPVIELIQGTLNVVQTKKGWDYPLSYKDHKGKTKSIKVHEDQVHQGLRETVASGIAVEFEMEGGKQVRIRPQGEPWGAATEENQHVPQDGEFVHPYYFLRMEDRERFAGDLNSAEPIGHRRWQPGSFFGTLRVTLTVKTPLLICDNRNRTEDSQVRDHFIYPLRTGVDGKPELASSSVRGMLRSAYEAITNSRFGVFPGQLACGTEPAEKQGRRLGFRLPAQIQTVPCRVYANSASPTGLAVELLPGTGGVFPSAGAPLAAAWFGTYGGVTPNNPSSMAFAHRTEVWAYLSPWHYSRTTRSGRQISFDFWNVEEIRPVVVGGVSPTSALTRRNCSSGNASNATWGTPDWYRGYLCITHNNMLGKHDERFFFSNAPVTPVPLPIGIIQQWRQLIEDYQDQHQRELEQGRAAPSPLSPPNNFSRHITITPPALNIDERKLKPGDLCYAEVEASGSTWSVKALYPVTISRKLFDNSPLNLLPKSLRPAPSIEQLSPADRVFGWVNQDKNTSKGQEKAAYRSHVRVGPVTCETEAGEAIDEFEPKTLAILGQPKPQQGRFYLGEKRTNGKAQPIGRNKEEAGYNDNNRIRGPKIYLHHKRAEKYETADQWQNDNPQAFSSERSNQNRSVTGWVKPGAVFSLDLHVTNLSASELGALVWLLSLPEGHYLRLGLGKPLGFGNVRVEMESEKSHIADGAEWIKSLTGEVTEPAMANLSLMPNEFENVINQANPEVLTAFRIAATGLGDTPVHYPLTTDQSPGDGETYKWFVSNEKEGRRSVLPDLTDSNPFLKKHPPQ
ncbi:MAG: TIGR03986 family CRISPR-associated RAMP protein [Planctomycetaceae bacterium]|nr:TIGR03986 family CRISPR-associated RAMP protein [Planctomycetaceae bacterium]